MVVQCCLWRQLYERIIFGVYPWRKAIGGYDTGLKIYNGITPRQVDGKKASIRTYGAYGQHEKTGNDYRSLRRVTDGLTFMHLFIGYFF